MPKPPSEIDRASDRDWKHAPGGVEYARYPNIFDTPNEAFLIISKLPPDHVEPPHTHDCHYIEIVIEGSLAVGKAKPMMPGDVRITRARVGYGPLRAGSAGCVRLTIFEREEGSMPIALGAA